MSRNRRNSQKSEYEEIFNYQIGLNKLPEVVRQYPFAKCIGRMYKADFAWLDSRLIVEVLGGLYNGGRHATGAGIESDLERTAIAAALGWKVIGFSPRHIKSGWALQMTSVALGFTEMTHELSHAKEFRQRVA